MFKKPWHVFVAVISVIFLVGFYFEYGIGLILINLMGAGIIYCVVPAIVRAAIKRPMVKSWAIVLTIINSFLVCLTITMFYLSIYIEPSGGLGFANSLAAIIWGFVVMAILRFGHDKEIKPA